MGAWFRDKRDSWWSRLTRRNRRRRVVLDASGRNRPHPKREMSRKTAIVVATVAVTGIAVAIGFGLREAGRRLFADNPAFNIRKIEILGGPTIDEHTISEYLDVREGMNLFAFDIRRARRDFLRRTPSVRGLEISRILPDRLRISVVEREPLVRLGSTGPLVADRNGFLFVNRATTRRLPALIGGLFTDLRPGTTLQGMALAGVEVADLMDAAPGLGLAIEEIDVSGSEDVTLTLPGGQTVKLAWRGMGTRSESSRRNLGRKLSQLSATLQSERGRRLRTLDATVEDRVFGK